MREGEKKAMARRLRKKLTPAEALLWWRLRRDFDSWRFRRQHPIGPYITDFACIEARLVIEVDGATHGTPEEINHDERRTRYLELNGWRVVRFWNAEVVRNRDGIRDTILDALHQQYARIQQLGRLSETALVASPIRPSGPPSPFGIACDPDTLRSPGRKATGWRGRTRAGDLREDGAAR